MLYTILKHIHNFFASYGSCGTYKIVNGAISLDFIKANQYFLIEGSIFNDGVWKYGVDTLIDEEFDGCITPLNIPKEFLELVGEIQAYTAKTQRTGLQSESFGGYSYSKATTQNGTMADWQDVFRQRLNVWRKL